MVGQRFATLSPVIDEDEHTASWAITQAAATSGQSSAVKKKKEPEEKRLTLPVLGSLKMIISSNNVTSEQEKKNEMEALHRNRLSRNKRHKSIQGMFQAAKANKELSQALLHQNPSFNLNIPDHDLQQYLSPSKHIPPPLISPITRAPSLPEQEEEEEEDSGNELAVVPAPPIPPPEVIPHISICPTTPAPLTSDDLIKKSKVIQANAPSSLWKPNFEPEWRPMQC